MNNKQFAIVVAILVIGIVVLAHAQSSTIPIILSPVQTSMTGCAWGAGNTTGLALCPLSLSSGPALAIAVNGGAFTQIPMSQGSGGVSSFNGRTGSVTLLKSDVTSTGLGVSTAVTATSTLQ